MASDVFFTKEAEEDLSHAYSWYESCRPGLGDEFLSCVDARIEAIRRLPELHEKVSGDFRRSLVRRFPYAIFYEYQNNALTVFAVFHASRDSSKWRERLDGSE